MMLGQLIIRANETNYSAVVIIVYLLKSRAMVWRDERCLILFDKLLSTLSVIPLQLIIRVNVANNFCCFSYPLNHRSSLFATFIRFRLSFILFTSFFVNISLKFTFSSPNLFSLTDNFQ